MEITSGHRLGPYEIVSRIGAGGMGEVFQARDTRLERSVAIKILPADFAHNEQLRSRFEREAKTISQLNHPHICTVHDVGQDNGISYLVMELLEGESLADRIARGPLPISEVLRYGVQISEALDRAHRAGIVHRDLKPGNVMLTRTGAKLLDFGLAKRSHIDIAPDGATQQKPLTQEGTILGTFQYMAPEQLEGLDADARTDIFALGAVLYEMATGVRAFDGSTKTSLIAAIVSQDPKPLAQIQPLTPPAFEHVVDRCLAKNADDRWQSAHDVAEQLRWISEAGSQAGVAAPVTARKRSRERLAWSVAAVLAVALAVVGWLYSRAARDASRNFVWDVTPPQGMRFNAVGDESGALVISPDGTMAVCSATNGSGSQLWLRALATGEMKPLPGTEGASFPFWSPDSKKIGFFTRGWLKRVDVGGGAPITICDAGASRGGSWARDGTIVFTPDTQTGLFRVPATGGKSVPVTKLEGGKQTTHRWPWLLPDGKHFLYLGANHQDPTGGENGIYVGSLDGEPPKLLMQSTSNAVYTGGYLLFNRDQTLMAQPMSESGVLTDEPAAIADNVLYDAGIWRGAFSVSDTGLLVYHTGHASVVSNLRWLDRSGKELARVGEEASYWDIDLSPNGQKLAIPIGDPLREMWIHDLQRNTRTRLPVDQGWAGSAVFSPDGSTIYFDVLRNGHVEIIGRRVTGGGETRIAIFAGIASVRSISPDGKNLLVDDREGRIVRVPLSAPAKPVVLTQGKNHEAFASYSPDGKWIAYMSDQNGRYEVFVSSASDPTQKWQISSAGGAMPRWRRDGREIFYVDLSNKITAVSLERSGDDLAIGTPTPLFTIAPRPQCRPYDVTADGQRFIVNTIAEQTSPNAVAIANWKARLKR
ncbi:MAG: serine/threonine-protein kinase [Acidobacteriota bacterium]|nr:serine/threonine-protein kinase [Acidobacteriota bacterium]